MSWDDVWGVADDFNRNVNPVGIGVLNGYSSVTGKDLLTGEQVSRVDAAGNLIIAGIFHQTGAKLSNPSAPVQLEKQMGRATSSAKSAPSEPLPNKAVKELKVDTYKNLTRANVGKGLNADHIPSFASLKLAEEQKLGRALSAIEERNLKNNSLALSIDKVVHQTLSQTYGGRNTVFKQVQDASNPVDAIRNNVNTYRPILQFKGYSDNEIDLAIEKLTKPFLNNSNTNKK